MSLSANDILNADDLPIEKITVPEWGGDVYIGTMNGVERDSWEMYAASEFKKGDNVNVRAKIAALTLCDKSGKRLFTDDQLVQLSKKSSKALDRVYSAALKLNKLSDEDIEALEKN